MKSLLFGILYCTASHITTGMNVHAFTTLMKLKHNSSFAPIFQKMKPYTSIRVVVCTTWLVLWRRVNQELINLIWLILLAATYGYKNRASTEKHEKRDVRTAHISPNTTIRESGQWGTIHLQPVREFSLSTKFYLCCRMLRHHPDAFVLQTLCVADLIWPRLKNPSCGNHNPLLRSRFVADREMLLNTLPKPRFTASMYAVDGTHDAQTDKRCVIYECLWLIF